MEFGAAEEVAATDDHGHLCTGLDDLGDLVGDRGYDVGIETDLSPAEHFATELEEHAAEAGAFGLSGVGGFAHQHPHSSVRLTILWSRPSESERGATDGQREGAPERLDRPSRTPVTPPPNRHDDGPGGHLSSAR